MTTRYLLDTDICVYIARGKHRHIESRLSLIEPGRVGISAVTYGELAYGATKSRLAHLAQQSLTQLTLALRILPLDAHVAEIYGKLRAELEREGGVIGNNDLWIGAHSLSLDTILVTNNEHEFRRIDGLRIENWTTPA